jgi:hypothetical protein
VLCRKLHRNAGRQRSTLILKAAMWGQRRCPARNGHGELLFTRDGISTAIVYADGL